MITVNPISFESECACGQGLL